MDSNIEIKHWDDLNISTNLLRGIYSHGFENPSEVQKKAIYPIINKKDVIAQAQSGTGKTGAFSISSLQYIDVSLIETQVIIIVPTRELVLQIYKVMKGFKNIFSTLRFCTVFEEIQQFFRIKNKSRSMKRNLIAPKIRKFNNLIFKIA